MGGIYAGRHDLVLYLNLPLPTSPTAIAYLDFLSAEIAEHATRRVERLFLTLLYLTFKTILGLSISVTSMDVVCRT